MNISKIKENARVELTGKWKKGACIILAYLAVSFAIGFIIGLFEDSMIADLLDIVSSIIQVPIAFGLSYAFIKLKRGEDVKSFDFLNLGFSNFARAWKIGLREVLKLILPVIGLIISIVVLIGAMVGLSASLTLDGTGTVFVVLMIAGVVLYIASVIWLVVRGLLYSLTAFIAYDNPDMSSLEVVNESARMMKGNRGKIFLLSLSFIGWIVITILTFGLGSLWLLPYMIVAEICFYESLLGKNIDNNLDENIEVIKEM